MIDFIINIPMFEGVPDAITAANKAIAGGAERGEICVSMAIADAGPNKGYRHVILGFEKKRADPRFELEALICEREGMIADNMQRAAIGQSMAWRSEDFDIIAEKIRALGKGEPG